MKILSIKDLKHCSTRLSCLYLKLYSLDSLHVLFCLPLVFFLSEDTLVSIFRSSDLVFFLRLNNLLNLLFGETLKVRILLKDLYCQRNSFNSTSSQRDFSFIEQFHSSKSRTFGSFGSKS